MTVVAFRETLLTRAELARALHVSTKTIQRWETAGMPSLRWGARLRRYRLQDCENWLREAA